MKTTITTTWEHLLESIIALEEEQGSSKQKNATTNAASLHTLALALAGLGRAWQEIEKHITDPKSSDEGDSRYTPQRVYTRPLATALLALGSSSPAAAIGRVGEIMANQLTAGDKDLLPKSRLVRWETNVRFARDMLRQRGLLYPPDGTSRWHLTAAGEKWARSSEPLPAIVDANQGILPF